MLCWSVLPLLFCSLVVLSKGTRGAVYETNCTLEPHLPCTIESSERACPWFPQSDGPYPHAAADFSISPSSAHNASPFAPLHVTWRLPDDDTIRHVTGFRLAFYAWTGTVNVDGEDELVSCHVFDLSGAKLTERDRVREFEFLQPLGDQYRVELTVLPHPGPGFVGSTQSLWMNEYEPYDSNTGTAKWAPELLIIEPRPCNRSVHVSFTPPPFSTEFTDFKVDLYHDSSGNYIGQKEIKWHRDTRMVKTIFKNVASTSGLLHVTVRPDHYKKGPCRCFLNDICHRCSLTQSNHFKWNNCAPRFPVTPSPQPNDPAKQPDMHGILGICIPLLVFIIALAILVTCIYKKYFRKRPIFIVHDGTDTRKSHNRAVAILSKLLQKLGNQVETCDMFDNQCPDINDDSRVVFIKSDNISEDCACFEHEYEKEPPVLRSLESHSNKKCTRFRHTNHNLKIPHLSLKEPTFHEDDFCLPDDLQKLLEWLGVQDKAVQQAIELEEYRALRSVVTSMGNESGYDTHESASLLSGYPEYQNGLPNGGPSLPNPSIAGETLYMHEC